MDTRRLILFVIFSFSTLMLWDAWQRQHTPPVVASQPATGLPAVAGQPATQQAANTAINGAYTLAKAQRIKVETDLYSAEIDTVGGDLRKLTLKKHRADTDKKQNYVLMNDAANPMIYVAQSGFVGENMPSHKTVYTAASTNYIMNDGEKQLEVRLSSVSNGVSVDKVYLFKRGNYAIDVNFDVKNGGTAALNPTVYYQIMHDNQSNQGSMLMPKFTGGVYYTEADKFKKVSFSHMADKDLSVNAKDGWVGLLQLYFVSSWIPNKDIPREYYSTKLNEHLFAVGAKSALATIPAGANLVIPARLYSGPQTQKDLLATAPGLEYTVDYGWLTVIAKPLFWVLSQIHDLVQNWGVAIILLTVLLKLLFYPLSAASYRSMAHMREVAPKLQAMKEKFGDDKQKMQQAMIELYRTEKINPMGGCLPILLQIPVFIALYWTILGSIELRNAPFFGWITDLSAIDPWYILPVLMGATMIIQTRLNPVPTDPIQAKVMKIMPVVFSVFFFFFPAGLVLYWLVNNILSIAQQWHINRTIHAETLAKKGHPNQGNAK